MKLISWLISLALITLAPTSLLAVRTLRPTYTLVLSAPAGASTQPELIEDAASSLTFIITREPNDWLLERIVLHGRGRPTIQTFRVDALPRHPQNTPSATDDYDPTHPGHGCEFIVARSSDGKFDADLCSRMFPAGDGLPHPNHYEIWYNPRARRVGKIAVYNPHSFTIKTSRGTTYLVIARGANKVSFYRCDPPAALK